MCDCNLTLVGVVSLAPAGAFEFAGDLRAADRLETAPSAAPLAPLEISPADWPTLRADNARTAMSQATVPDGVRVLWTARSRAGLAATAPTAAGGLVFVGGHDGAVRALDAATGDVRWTAYTGGPITYPPTLWQGRALVGAGDGWIYCFEAATGRTLWRFRAAPAERMIPVYGSLRSTWPVASGVLVGDGVAYAAAGIANHDGTHVFALDAETGEVRWHNPTSGSLDPQTHSGVSVNGHLLLHGPRLYLAGGNMAPVATYDLATGRCLTDPSAPKSHTQFTAGSDLFLIGDQVQSGGPPLHAAARGDYRMVNQATLQTPVGDLVLAYGPHDSRMALFEPQASQQGGAKPRWQAQPLNRIFAVALTSQAIVLAGLRDSQPPAEPPQAHVVALSVKDGTTRWEQPLPAAPVPWGVLVDRAGRVVVSLQDGGLVCLAGGSP
jgi:outer membrane protein assembly factor BamB